MGSVKKVVQVKVTEKRNSKDMMADHNSVPRNFLTETVSKTQKARERRRERDKERERKGGIGGGR